MVDCRARPNNIEGSFGGKLRKEMEMQKGVYLDKALAYDEYELFVWSFEEGYPGREFDDLLKEAVAEMRMPDRTVILVAHRCCEQTTHIKQQTTNNKHTQQEHPDFVGLAPVYSTHPKIIANLSPDDPYITPTSYRNRSKILP